MPLRSSGLDTLVVNVAMLGISTLAIILRFTAKLKTHQPLAAEDAFILLSLAILYAYVGIILYAMLQAGGTLEFKEANTPASITIILQCIYTLTILLTTLSTTVKLSILLWYRTVFTKHAVRIHTLVASVLCLLWYIIVLSLSIFRCNPVHHAWDIKHVNTTQCISYKKLVVGSEATNIAIDFLIMCIPVAVIRRLQLSAKRKVLLVGIFCLGGFVCVAGSLRIVYITGYRDFEQVGLYQGPVWCSVEIGVATVCACLPMLGPLFRKTREESEESSSTGQLKTAPSHVSSYGRSSADSGIEMVDTDIH